MRDSPQSRGGYSFAAVLYFGEVIPSEVQALIAGLGNEEFSPRAVLYSSGPDKPAGVFWSSDGELSELSVLHVRHVCSGFTPTSLEL